MKKQSNTQLALALIVLGAFARISQIMNLLQLAPDLQERLLFFTRPPQGRDPVHLARLQPIAAALNWRTQRRLWRERLG